METTLVFSEGTLVWENEPPGRPEELSRQVAQRFPAPVDRKPAWTWDPRIRAWRSQAFYYPLFLSLFNDEPSPPADQVPGWEPVAWPSNHLPPLLPEQRQAMESWQTAGCRGVVVMPTGTGKTEVAIALLRKLACAALVVAPVRDLMYQWHRRLETGLGYDAGIIGDRVFRVRPVSVTTYDSAWLHMARLGNRFRLVIFDECHHLPGERHREAASLCAAPFRLGLTATPERLDGREADLAWLIGPIVYRLPMSAARGRLLADYGVVTVPVRLTAAEQARYDTLSRLVRDYLRERRRECPGYTWEHLRREAGRNPAALRAWRAAARLREIEERAAGKFEALSEILGLHAGERVLIFTGSNAAAREVSLRFLAPCLLHHCRKKERREILEAFRNGTRSLLVANQVLDEGVDLPEAKVAVVTGGTSSARQAKQRLGRLLRRSEGRRAVLYELVCRGTAEIHRSRRRRESDAFVSC